MAEKTASTLSPLDAHLGFWLRAVSNAVSERFAHLLAAHGVTVAEWVALRTLYDRDGTTHAELIAALAMTKGAVSKIVTRLEAKGLAGRRPHGDGGREQQVCLTASGRRLVPRLVLLADENDRAFFAHLPEAEREDLLRLLRGMAAHHGFHAMPVE